MELIYYFTPLNGKINYYKDQNVFAKQGLILRYMLEILSAQQISDALQCLLIYYILLYILGYITVMSVY